MWYSLKFGNGVLQHESIGVDKIAEEIKTRISSLPDSGVASVRLVRRELSRRLAKADPQQVIELALSLLDEPELRWVACELVHHPNPRWGV